MIPLLKATIDIDENNNASVELKKLHPDLANYEYARLVLHYYAKILFNFDPKQPESNAAYLFLLTAIDNISNAALNNTSDILMLADIDDVVQFRKPKGECYRYIADFFSVSSVRRHIKTKIPCKVYLQQMSFSVPILIHGVLQYLNDSGIEIMKLAFKEMNKQYYSGVDIRKMESINSVPISAYTSAFMSDERSIFSDFIIIRCPNPDCTARLKVQKSQKSKKLRCKICEREFDLNKD